MLLNKVSNINENLQLENEKISKQIIQLVQLLQTKDKHIASINKDSQKDYKLIFKKEYEEKLMSSLLKLLVKRKLNLVVNKKERSFFIWRFKSNLFSNIEKIQLFFKNELKILENNRTINNTFKSLGIENNRFSFIKNISKVFHKNVDNFDLKINKFNFNFLSTSKFLDRIIQIFTNKRKILYSNSFSQILKFSYFSVVKSKMLIFKKILINKKLKYILNQKYIRSIKKYFDHLKTEIILNNKIKETSDLNLQSQPEIINSNNKLNKILILIQSKFSNNYKIKLALERWKNFILKSKSIEHIDLINSYKNIEDEFSNKISEIEKAYESNVGDILRKNKDLDRKLREANKELEKYRMTIEVQSENIEELSEIIEKSRNEDQGLVEMKNKINILHEKYENELKSLRSENENMRENFEELSHNLKNEKIQNKELEKKLTVLNSINEKLKQEMTDLLKKHENLKILSSQTADELIKTNQEITKLRSEHKFLTEAKNNLTANLEKINNEISSRDRLIKQLKLNEDTLNHQFQMDRERIENKFLNEKNNLLEKIDLLEKEKDMTRDQIKNLNKENKNLNEKLRGLSDYSTLKKEVIHLRDKVVSFENENTSVKLQNLNLQKQIEGLIDTVATENRKYEITKLEVK
jgi:chromosome segregation ATPase